MSFNAVVGNNDPIGLIETLYQLSNPQLQQVVYSGFTSYGPIELEGETRLNYIQRAVTTVDFLKINIADISAYNALSGETAKNDYIEALNTDHDANPLGYNTVVGYTEDVSDKNNYISVLKNNYLSYLSGLRADFGQYDALLFQIEVEDLRQLIIDINLSIRRNEYQMYRYLKNILKTHYTGISTIAGTDLFDLLKSEFEVKLSPSTSDILNEKALLNYVIQAVRNRIKVSNLYSYKQMNELSKDLKNIIDIVPFIPTLNTDMTNMLGQVWEVYHELFNEMDAISVLCEMVLIEISNVTNEVPYNLSTYLSDKNKQYDDTVRTYIRLRPQ